MIYSCNIILTLRSIFSVSGYLKNVPTLFITHTGFEQNNGNTTYTVHISLLIWCWTTFCLQYSCSPWVDSYMFWTISSRILYHCSWRTSSNCFRDVGGRNLFLRLVSRTDQNGSVMFKYGDFAGQGSCWSSPSCFSHHDWTVSAVWMETLLSW
jgi:hypothetical protein